VIPNDAVTNALRKLNFTFKRQADRVMIWKQRGSTRRVSVRRRDLHDPDAVRTLLKQAGMPHDEIENFINATNK
jgi:hypothetical protein